MYSRGVQVETSSVAPGWGVLDPPLLEPPPQAARATRSMAASGIVDRKSLLIAASHRLGWTLALYSPRSNRNQGNRTLFTALQSVKRVVCIRGEPNGILSYVVSC